MTGQTTVVTPERFSAGLTYENYLAQINVNKERFEQFYESAQLDSDDAEFFRSATQHPNGPAKMLVIGEDWCPDVYRGMPVMARIAEASGLELRVFPRDQHLDIADEFLKQGEFRSIPVAVFYTKNHEYIGHWIERPAQADQERGQIALDIQQEFPEADEEKVRSETRSRTQAKQPGWQQASIKEMRKIIADKLGTS